MSISYVIFISIFFCYKFQYIASQSIDFVYTGSVQTWIAPSNVHSIQVILKGACGGGIQGGASGGLGGVIQVHYYCYYCY